MQDKIETYGRGSVVQQGHKNGRVYLMKLVQEDFPGIIEHINNLTREHAYTKIFCKVPCWATPAFLSKGFIVEAHIPRFYNNREDVFFLSKFLDSDRIMSIEHKKLEELSQQLLTVGKIKNPAKLKSGFSLLKLKADRADEIAGLYKQVFDSYPFPIFDSEYILFGMKNNVQFFGIERQGQLTALASAETDRKGANAEMTDFATLPDFRGNSLSVILLSAMEQEMKQQGIFTLYTIARLNSTAMNRTFLRLHYRYAGTLIKNTNIAGNIESMNVFYKHIQDAGC
ncbi:MAG: putative beta-lysine N-acetyltransferase [Bacteroidales bacterium]|nr:putative beta-lysine N-acetyltransferase [Bacteroidales bacterium]